MVNMYIFWQNCTADNLCCVEGAEDCVVAGLDMSQICDKVNMSGTKTKAEISHDPGRLVPMFFYIYLLIVVLMRNFNVDLNCTFIYWLFIVFFKATILLSWLKSQCRNFIHVNNASVKDGSVVEWLTRRTSNLRITSHMGSKGQAVVSLSKKLHWLLSTGWFQEWIRECFYKLKAFFTIELK